MTLFQIIVYYFHWSVIFIFSISLSCFIFISNFSSYITFNELKEQYDYIIVGGGSAGAVLAFRLSENTNVSVLLIEAGTSVPGVLNIPILGPLKQNSDFDWQYKTVSQKQSCFGLKNNESLWPTGKVLGGSTHLNYMIYLKGNENDFSSWKDPESDEWSINDINFYFNKAEEYISNVNGECNKNYRNKTGSILVREAPFTTVFSNVILKAALEIGYNIKNLNSEGNTGFMTPQVNINKDGKRWTSEQKLKDVLCCRRNLKVLLNTVVEKVLFKNGFEAYGVSYKKHGQTERIYAREEIILSAGTIGSAKILLLSGVGPKDVLSKNNIPVRVDLPVGRNLQDHITTGLDLVILNETIFSMNDLTNPVNAVDYFVHGKGPFTSALVDAIGVVHSDLANSELKSPDLEFMVMMAGVSSDGGLFSRHSLGISDKLWDGYFSQLTNSAAVSILPVLLHPKSIGEVELDPKDPSGSPIINPKYLSHEEDIKVLVRGIRILQKLVNTTAMRSFGAKFNNLRLPGCESFRFDSNEYWQCYVRHLTLTSYHPVGTCKMGHWKPGAGSVVNHRLRVHKTNKLRVIDASIMPTMPSANTNAAVVMLAEKGADLVKEDYYGRRSLCSARDVFFFMASLKTFPGEVSFFRGIIMETKIRTLFVLESLVLFGRPDLQYPGEFLNSKMGKKSRIEKELRFIDKCAALIFAGVRASESVFRL